MVSNLLEMSTGKGIKAVSKDYRNERVFPHVTKFFHDSAAGSMFDACNVWLLEGETALPEVSC